MGKRGQRLIILVCLGMCVSIGLVSWKLGSPRLAHPKWTFQTAHAGTGVVVDGNNIYIAFRGQIYALAAASGSVLWKQVLDANMTSGLVAGTLGTLIHVGERSTNSGQPNWTVAVVDGSRGNVKWTFHPQQGTWDKVTHSGNLVFLCGDGIIALDGRLGTVLWTHKLVARQSGAFAGLPIVESVACSDSRLCFTTAYPDRRIIGLDSRTGRKLWEHELPASILGAGHNITRVAMSPGGLVVEQDPDYNLTAYDARTGRMLWHKSITSPMEAAPLYPNVSEDSKMVLVSTWRGRILRLNSRDGSILWNTKVGDHIRSAPLFLSAKSVCVGSGYNTVTLLNMSSGAISGVARLPVSPVTFLEEYPDIAMVKGASAETIYASSTDYHVYAIGIDAFGIRGLRIDR